MRMLYFLAMIVVVLYLLGSSQSVVPVPLAIQYQYNLSLISDLYDIYWSVDDEYLHLALSANASGWVGFGFYTGPDIIASMTLSDTILTYVDNNGKAHIQDCWVPFQWFAQPKNDVSLNGTNDWILIEGKYLPDKGRTVMEMKRKLTTNDTYDMQFTQEQILGTTKIIFAYQSKVKPWNGFEPGSFVEHDLYLTGYMNIIPPKTSNSNMEQSSPTFSASTSFYPSSIHSSLSSAIAKESRVESFPSEGSGSTPVAPHNSGNNLIDHSTKVGSSSDKAIGPEMTSNSEKFSLPSIILLIALGLISLFVGLQLLR
jgi:hypothetical protein